MMDSPNPALGEGSWKSGPRLLAVVTPGTSAERVVNWTRRLAESLNSPWIALYVETPRDPAGAASATITQALALAKEFGAEVITTMDDDLVRGVLRIATQQNATQIVVGNAARGRRIFSRNSFATRLIKAAWEFEIHVVPVEADLRKPSSKSTAGSKITGWKQYAVVGGALAALTLASLAWGPKIGAPHVVALIYLLFVVLVGSFARRGPTLMAAAMSALLCDYFILPPALSFHLDHPQDLLFPGTYLVVAVILGQLTSRIRAQELAERSREERATALYLLTRELNEASTLDQIAQRAIENMEHAFHAKTVLYNVEPMGQLKQLPVSAEKFSPSEQDKQAMDWVMRHGERAGKATANMPATDLLFAPLATSGSVIGLIGLRLPRLFSPTIHQFNLLDSFLHQIAFALDRHRLREDSARAKLLAESERLGKTLLNSMSHEIRTPIAVISSAANNLGFLLEENENESCSESLAAIQHASTRLNRLVGNILDITRLESGHLQPRMSQCDVRELVHESVNSLEEQLARHPVTIQIDGNLPLVPLDFALTEQALANLLSNAAFHTSPGTEIFVRARTERDFLVIEVADRGPGIPLECLDRVFEKFYRAPGAPTGGTGLGLSLVKGFVEAQGGVIKAGNRAGGGAIFTIHLPLGELDQTPREKIYEQRA